MNGKTIARGVNGFRKTQRLSPLSPAYLKFCEIYFVKRNAAEAYIEAISPNCSRINAKAAGWKILQKVQVRQMLRQMQEEATRQSRVTVTRLIAEVEKIAFGDMRKLFDANGQLLPPHLWPADATRLVAGFQTVERLGQGLNSDGNIDRIVKERKHTVKFVSRLAALELSAKLLGLFDKGLTSKNAAANHAPLVVVLEGDQEYFPTEALADASARNVS